MISVLYVDDEPDLLDLGKLFIEESGDFSVTTCESASAAMDLLKTRHYDAIISDYQMRETDGLEFLKNVRLRYGQVPFILFTGKGREDVIIEAINSGADFYLQKGGALQPQFAELMHKVRQAVSKNRAEVALIESQSYLNQIFSSVKAGILVVDATSGKILDINPAGADLIGLPKEEITGNLCHKFVCPAETGRCPIMDLHQSVDNSERVLITGDGRSIPVIKYVTRMNLDGRECLLETFIDNRERKAAEETLLRKTEDLHAAFEELTATEEELRYHYDLLGQKEQALRESEETFRAMVEQSSEGIIIVDFFGMLQFANRRAWDIIEYSPDRRTAENFNVLEIVSPELRENALRDFIKVSGGTDSYLVNYKIITPEKTEKWIECIGKKISYKGTSSMLLSFRDITERRKTEYAVAESEKKFRTIFENSPYPISINSIPDGKFIAVNGAFLHSSGYTEAEIRGKTPVELGLLSLLDFGRLSSHLLFSGKLENVPMVLKGKGGTRVHVQFSTIPVTISDHPAILTMTAEITKLKRVEEELEQKNQELAAAFEELTASEEELRQNYDQLAVFQTKLQESEAQFRTLFAISPDGIILFDLTGRITIASPEALRVFHVSSMDEAVGTSVFDWVEPEYHDLVRKTMVELLDGKFQHAVTYRVRRRDGSSFFVESSHGIFPGADGHPDGFIVVIRDITDRRLAEKALRESEEQYRSLAEQVHDGIYIYQGNRFVFVNSFISRITGYSKDELLSMDFIDLVHPDDRAYAREITERRRRGEQVPDTYELRIILKDGSVLNAEFAVATILFGGGNAVLGTARDITERKQAEKALRQANKKLNLLSSVTRHDINNQLQALSGFLEILHRKTPDPALEKFFSRITQASARIAAMIEFTKEYEAIGIAAPVWQDTRTLVETAATEAPLGKVNVKNDIPSCTEVFADPLIAKVLYNLMDNAVRYGGKITAVRFTVQEQDGNQILVCEDDGDGVPAEEKERIFDRGFGKNTGLGLALSREILDITGITIRETGEHGKGARFEIVVPKGMWRIVGTGA
jgi:PAS domain S-box-containing protein